MFEECGRRFSGKNEDGSWLFIIKKVRFITLAISKARLLDS